MMRMVLQNGCGRFAAVLGALALSASCEQVALKGSFAGVEMTPAQSKPAFTFTATSGQPFDFRRETDGRLTLLFFGYTHCPDVCPVHLANIAATLRRLSPGERARIRVVFVTTDPARDSLPRIRAWLDNFDSTFVGLRGSDADIARVESSLGLAPSSVEPTANGYGVAHAAQVLAFTSDDSLRVVYPFGIRQQDWAHDLPLLLAVGGRR